MYARSSTFRGPPDSIDAGIEFVHSEVLPTILVMDGCVGLSMLANRETGHCITVSAWHSLESRKDSEAEVGDLRARIGERLSTTPEVNQWEIALLQRDHRSQEGARARLTWVEIDPAEIGRLVDFTRSTTLPTLKDVPGFCSASLVIDPGAGKGGRRGDLRRRGRRGEQPRDGARPSREVRPRDRRAGPRRRAVRPRPGPPACSGAGLRLGQLIAALTSSTTWFSTAGLQFCSA